MIRSMLEDLAELAAVATFVAMIAAWAFDAVPMV